MYSSKTPTSLFDVTNHQHSQEVTRLIDKHFCGRSMKALSDFKVIPLTCRLVEDPGADKVTGTKVRGSRFGEWDVFFRRSCGR